MSCVAAILSISSFLSSSGRRLIGVLIFHNFPFKKKFCTFKCFCFSFKLLFADFFLYNLENLASIFLQFSSALYPVFFLFSAKSRFSVPRSTPLIGGTSTTFVIRFLIGNQPFVLFWPPAGFYLSKMQLSLFPLCIRYNKKKFPIEV